MRAKRMMLSIIMCLLAMTIALQVAFAQGQAQDTKKGEFKITIKGKIQHMEQLGGYYLLGENPGGEFMIVNQNPKVLGTLMKSKKTVTVEGSLKGAEWLTIEKIDGKLYSGKAASK
jgi:hypothetical protein